MEPWILKCQINPDLEKKKKARERLWGQKRKIREKVSFLSLGLYCQPLKMLKENLETHIVGEDHVRTRRPLVG